MRIFYFPILSIIFLGCGETPPTNEQFVSLKEYILIQPTQPPFIEFNDSDIGDVDDFEFEKDVEFPTTPIPSVPEIGL